MKDLKQIAKEACHVSPVLDGRTKITTADMIARGGTFTPCLVDIFSGDCDTYPVFAFREDPARFYAGGTRLNTLVNEWVKAFDGDLDALNAALTFCPVTLQLIQKKNKKGQPYVDFEVVD